LIIYRVISLPYAEASFLAVGLGKGKWQCRRPGERATAARYEKNLPKKLLWGASPEEKGVI